MLFIFVSLFTSKFFPLLEDLLFIKTLFNITGGLNIFSFLFFFQSKFFEELFLLSLEVLTAFSQGWTIKMFGRDIT